MPFFHYVALNQSRQELSGVIEAPDELAARQRLNAMGLSIVSISTTGSDQTIAAAPQKGKKIFEFEAFDKNGKKIAGTISADDAVKAYARLFDEYNLNVNAFFLASLNEKDKEEARRLGISALHKQYEKIYGIEKKKRLEQEQKLLFDQQKTRNDLIDKVDFTIKSVETFLQQYAAELKSEERESIQSYINQLMRIKESTNLEHIRTTCERMLKHIQDQELFMQEEQKYRESAKIKIETKELLSQLKATGLHKEINIEKMVLDWRKYAVLKPIANFLLSIVSSPNPAIRMLKDQIKVINKHIVSYIGILIFGKSKIFRIEAWESIKTLRETKKRLKLEIKAIKFGETKTLLEQKEQSLFLENLATVLGWLLAFYLISYIVSYLFTIKKLTSISTPRNFYFYSTSLTKAITVFLFIAFNTIQLRVFWLKKHPSISYGLYFTSFFGFLLIVINLM